MLPPPDTVLAPFATLEFDVDFSPTVEGDQAASLTVFSDGGDATVDLAGRGYEMRLARQGIAYGTTGRQDGGRLITINRVTGAGTLVGATGLSGAPGLAINSQGEMFGTERVTGDVYRIDARRVWRCR